MENNFWFIAASIENTTFDVLVLFDSDANIVIKMWK